MKSPQFWAALVCLLGTFLLVQLRGDTDRVPPSAPLAGMPSTFGPWTSRDLPISASVLEILGKGEFLNRLYTQDKPASTDVAGENEVAPIQFFIAYFPTQRSGQSIHSPQNCLPGSGWTFLSSGVTSFTDPSGKEYNVGDYVISDGRSKQEVLYWYQSHGRSIASDYKAKLLMLTDSIRYGRTDAALVRLITPVAQNENPAQAHSRLISFAKLVTPLLPAYVPN